MENRYNITRLDRKIYYLGFARFIRATGRVSSFIFLPLVLISVYGLPFMLTGLLIGFATLIMAIVQMYSGKMTDKIGRRFFMIIIPLPNVAAYFVMYLAIQIHLSVYILLSTLYISIFVNALQYPALQAAVADLSPPEFRMSAYTIVRIMANTGAAFGPLFGGILAGIGFQYVFLLASIATIVEILILFYVVPETYSPNKAQKGRSVFSWKKNILLDRYFLAFIVIGVVFAFFMRQNSISLTVYAVVLASLPVTYLGYIFALNGLIVVLLQFPMLKLMTKRFSAMTWRSVGAAFYASAFLILSISPAFYIIIIYMLVSTIGENFISPTTQTIVTNIAPSTLRGTYIGIYSFMTRFGSFAGSFLGLMILYLFRNITSTFWIYMAVGMFLVSLSYLLLGMTPSRHISKVPETD